MPDVQQLQTLGVKVTLDGAQQAAQGLDNVAQAGARAEVATKRLIGTNDGLTASQRFLAQQNAQTIAAMEKTLGTTLETTGAVTKATVAMTEEAVAHNEAAAAAGIHGLQLGRVNQELGTFIGRALGANTAATRLTAQLGGAAVGYQAMIPVLLAVGAAVRIHEAWAEGASKAAEEQAKLTEELTKWYDKQREGVAGDFPKQIEAMTAKIKELHVALDATMESKFFTGDVAEVGQGGSKLSAWLRIFSAGSITGAITQFKIEAAKGAAEAAKTIDDGGKAVQAAQDEVAKRLNDDAIEKQRERFKAMEALYTGPIANAVTDGVNKQIDAMRKANLEAGVEDATQQKLNATEGISGGIKEYLNAQWDAQIARIKAYGTESGIALTQTLATIDATEHEAESRAKLAMKIEEQKNTTVLLTNAQKEAEQIGNRNAKTAKDQTDAAAAQIKYAQDIQDIWTKGIEKIVTNGTKSFHDFFDDVLRMFEQLMKRMEKAGNDSGIGYQLLGLGSSAITGGVAGYQLGQSTGSTTAGFLGGAAGGALAGDQIAGPWGALVGGLAGAAGGLLGAASAQQKAAAALKAAADAFAKQETQFIANAGGSNAVASQLASIDQQYRDLIAALNDLYSHNPSSAEYDQYRQRYSALTSARDIADQTASNTFISDLGNQLNALNGGAGSYANQLDAINKKYQENIASARALGLSEQAGSEITTIYQKSIDALNASMDRANTTQQQSALARLATANGNTDLAAWLQLQFRHQQTLDDDVAQGLSDATIALDKQANAAEDAAFQLQLLKNLQQKQLDAANALLGEYQKQTDAQSQAIQQTQQVVDTLQKFKDSIGLSALSTLSPGQQVASARQQFQALVAQAMTGDATAASGLPGSAQTLLQASRSYNASGAGYVKDYKDVLAAVGAVQDQFGGTLSTEQLMLKELQRQTDQLNKQIALLQTGNQTAAAQYVQATLDAASRNGNLNDAMSGLRMLFPGLSIGYNGSLQQSPGGAPGLVVPTGTFGAINADYRDFDTYWSDTVKGYGGIQSFLDSGYPGAQSILTRLHDDGIPGYWTGGAFGGGLMRVGEHGPEIIASGRASVMTPQQINAGIEKRLDTLIARFDQLTNVTRLNGAKATAHR